MNKPEIESYQYHAILCCGSKCEPEGDRSLLLYMKAKLSELGMSGVRVNRGGCLGVCVEGPIMVVYPGGVWYCNMTQAGADRIIEEHFGQGKVVQELLFHQSGKR